MQRRLYDNIMATAVAAAAESEFKRRLSMRALCGIAALTRIRRGGACEFPDRHLSERASVNVGDAIELSRRNFAGIRLIPRGVRINSKSSSSILISQRG